MSTVATVVNLTATVTTLEVGSRQVTLSVARQLDVVPWQRLEIFGRIRLSQCDGVELIGKHGFDETLVRAIVSHNQECSSIPVCTCNVQHFIDNYPLIVLAGLK